MTMPRIIRAKNIHVGDFYIPGMVDGQPVGEQFTVHKVRKSTYRDTLSIHRDESDVIGTTLDNDQLVIIERN